MSGSFISARVIRVVRVIRIVRVIRVIHVSASVTRAIGVSE